MKTPPLLRLLATLLCLHIGCSDAANADCPKKTSNTLDLKKQLFCSYDASVRPVKSHTNTTNVSVKLGIKFVIFNEHYNTLEVRCLAIWKWNDEHLTWDKNEYGGLDDLRVTTNDVWIPDVTVYNAGSMHSVGTGIPDAECTVDFDGDLHCFAHTSYLALCTPNIRRWPFDSHTCSLRIGSWSYKGDALNLTYRFGGVHTAYVEKDKEWELVSVNATRESISFENVTFPWLLYQFEMKRHSGGHAASIVTPSVVLSFLTLVTFWMNPENVHRLGLICVNILCHSLFVMYLGSMLPANGDETPVIVTFFRDSFLLVGASLLVTVCAARMSTAARAAPAWISSITDVVAALPLGQLLVGELDAKGMGATEDNTNSTGVEAWRLFATLLDRLFFGVFLITLVILLCAYLP